MTLLAIVGAGASYDCAPWLDGRRERKIEVREGVSRVPLTVGSARPPLTRQLFDNREAFSQFVVDYGSVRPLIGALRRADEDATALEDQLADYEQAATHDPAKRYHLMAMRFYLRDVLLLCTEAMLSIQADAGLTNYVTLVNTLHEWAAARSQHVCCVSFNYDTLLEQACQDVWRFDRRNVDNYTDQDPTFSIVKPHGSSDWEHTLAGATTVHGSNTRQTQLECARRAIEAATDNFEHGPMNASQDPFAPGRTTKQVAVPAIAPPIREKADLIWPAGQRNHFGNLKGQVTRLLVIGWRAAEPHFTEMVTETFEGLALPTLIVTGGPNAEREGRTVAVNLELRPDSDTVAYHTGGFSDLVSTGRLEEWLAA